MRKTCDGFGEGLVVERFDAAGARWVKVYVGGGLHFVGWLEQFREVYGVLAASKLLVVTTCTTRPQTKPPAESKKQTPALSSERSCAPKPFHHNY